MKLDWHDGELARVTVDGDVITLHFSAALLSNDASSGWQRGWWLSFTAASWQGAPERAFGRIVAGRLWRDGALHTLQLSDAEQVARWRCELQLGQGDELLIDAQALRCGPFDRTCWHEDLRC